MTTLKKIGIFFFLFAVAIGMAGIYGILHDQCTYSLSSEYYTKFKFYQFGLMDVGNEALFSHPRIQVAAVGWMASWWMGIPIGLLLGLVGMFHRNGQSMWRVTLRAFYITLGVTLVAGLLGLCYGHFYLSHQPRSSFYNWYLPNNLVDYKSFIKVGSMHNFSYFGGLIGLISGVIYSVRQRVKNNPDKQPAWQLPAHIMGERTIDMERFHRSLTTLFGTAIIYFERFKPELYLYEIDAWKDSDSKLAMDVAPDVIELSVMRKDTEIDFSLHKHRFYQETEALQFIESLIKKGI